jgi:polar amino acid transport system permease protein/polar amino acid transport system substrate-binding protein
MSRFRARLAILLLVVSGLAARAASADALADVRARGELVWGADQEGGGPYVYPRDDDPMEVTGFEVEIATRLAELLGVRARFFQSQWDKLPECLHTRKIDVILNGYERTAARLESMDATLPYFVYGLQLLARRDDASLAGWDDLARAPRRRKVGVLVGSAAEGYLQSRSDLAIDVVPYDGNTDAMRETETGKIDATLQDTPIVAFYGTRFPRLRPVAGPVAPGHYVAYVRKGETGLVTALNEALIVLVRDGEIEGILRRYGLWAPAQEELRRIAEAGRFFGYARAADGEAPAATRPALPAVSASARPHGWEVVRRYGGVLLQSAGLTVVLSVLSFPLAIAAGLMIAIGRLHGPAWLRAPLAAYVEFLRGTPLMLQLYFIFFFLPEIGIAVPAFWTAILGLAVNYSAYESEIYRAGLQAIPPGQMEAALSLGMSRPLALRRVIVPQAVRIVIPPVVNDFIALFKDTSVCSVVTLVELTKRFSVLSQSTQATVELMILTAVLYLLMSAPLTLVSRRLERRLGAEPAR